MPSTYGPYGTSNTSGVDVLATYAAEDDFPYNPPPPFELGQLIEATDNGEWVFVKASEPIAAGNVCFIDLNFNATRLTSANGPFGRKLGIAPVAVNSGESFWMQVNGYCLAITASAAGTASAQTFSTATAGAITTVSASGLENLQGITFQTAPTGAGNFPGWLNHPTVGASVI